MTALLLALLVGEMAPPSATAAARAPAAADAALDAPQSRSAKSIDASQKVIFGLRWRQPIVQTGFFRTVVASFSRPAVSKRHGLIVVGTGEGDIKAFALADGTPVWSYHHGAPFEGAASIFEISRAPVVPQGQAPVPGTSSATVEVAVLGSLDGNLLAIEVATGVLLWSANVGADIRAPAAKAGDWVIVSTSRNRLFAFELASGKAVWNTGRPAPAGITVAGHAAPLVAGGLVYCGFSDGYVEAYSLEDGSRVWSRPLSLRGGEFNDADADPVLSGGRLFVASYSDGVYALDPKDGSILWSRAVSGVKSLAVNADKVIAGSGDGWVWGLGQADGALAYRTRLTNGLVSRIEVHNGLALFAGGESGLVVLDAFTGRPLQATGFQTRMHGDPAWVGSEIALVSAPGYLYSFSRAAAGPVD